MLTATLVRPPANTQKRELSGLPSTTLTTISTLFAEKNQKYPVSGVNVTACPAPFCAWGVVQVVCTLNRPPFRQRVVASAVHAANARPYESASRTSTGRTAGRPPAERRASSNRPRRVSRRSIFGVSGSVERDGSTPVREEHCPEGQFCYGQLGKAEVSWSG